MRCALELAELRDATHSIAPEMLGSLVKFRLSSISASFDHIGRLEHGWERAASLAKIIPFITKEHLSRVEQIIEDLKGEHQDHIADIFDALCARICQLVSIEAARELVSVAPAGYSRASVHMRLASLTHGKERNEELVAAFEEFEACDLVQRSMMVERYAEEFASGGDSGAAHFGGRIPAPVQTYIEENITGTVAPESFGLPIQCQYIKYILPFVSDTQRAEYIGAYFRGVLNGISEEFWYVGNFFKDNGQLVPTSLLAEAVAVADVAFKARDGFDFTAAILSLWPRLTDKQRQQWRPHLLEAIGKVDEWSSINDRRDAFALLGQRGFTATALEIIEAAPDDDWYTVDLIVAVAPHLSEEESERALALIQDIRLETQDRARRAILTRLASFSRESALAARRHAGSIDVGLEARIALNIVNALAAPSPGERTKPWSMDCPNIEDTIFRFSALQLYQSLFEPLDGLSVARLTASLIDFDRDAGRVSVAAFALLAETIDATDLCQSGCAVFGIAPSEGRAERKQA